LAIEFAVRACIIGRRLSTISIVAHTRRVFTRKGTHMKKILSVCLSLLFVFVISVTAQNSNSSTTSSSATAAKTPKKRGPIFRASKDQVQQAQKILKDRTFYAGEQTGKLDADTRAGLKKFQAAESLKVTGTLNKITLEKMGVALTDKQKAM
jgi:peptidoglycan hydrolase-like protein with peptidoglycan-binding domain